ncbi:hypothetical protein F7725_005033 [Dissostichus mawsoni]|uniref:Dickkopf N-terminal cysteine-rich domain-containing protein n=1 Tax=Dissostichus mawsoni TaxID=36200 RepID=A0A7J5XLZ6_DISMA|nr:hypothetical protein F7725_005033 [Dissostichus mawsoni]
MHPHSVLMVSLALVFVTCSRGGEARVRLNSFRTVILQEGHALPVNRSTWEPSLDLTLYQCMSDLECREGSYCHAPTKGPAHSRCQTCRRRKRRCHRDGMCCPGNSCSNNICVPDEDSFPVLRGGQVCTRHRRKGNHGLELFQRCPCGDGLSCRTLRDPDAKLSSSSPSSSLMAAVAESKFAASSSRHSSPHPSLLSSSAGKLASASPDMAKTRLHVCQKQ